MTALADGLHAGLHALAWTAGALTPFAACAALAWLLAAAVALVRPRLHRRATSRRLHATARSSGRTTTTAGPVRVLDGSEHTLPRG